MIPTADSDDKSERKIEKLQQCFKTNPVLMRTFYNPVS